MTHDPQRCANANAALRVAASAQDVSRARLAEAQGTSYRAGNEFEAARSNLAAAQSNDNEHRNDQDPDQRRRYADALGAAESRFNQAQSALDAANQDLNRARAEAESANARLAQAQSDRDAACA